MATEGISTSSGWFCSGCGIWVAYGTYHICQLSSNNFCVCCPQFQKLNQLLERLEVLMKKIEDKQQ